MIQTSSLPKLGCISQFVYDITPVPTSLAEAIDIQERLKIEVTDIIRQLEINKINLALDASDEKDYENLIWRKKAESAKRIKQQQIGLIRMWIKQNSPDISDESVLKKRAQETELFGVEGRKAITSLKREVNFLRLNLSETNAILISLLSEASPLKYKEKIAYLRGTNQKLLNLDRKKTSTLVIKKMANNMNYPTLDLAAIWETEFGKAKNKTPSSFIKIRTARELIEVLAQSLKVRNAVVEGKRLNHRWLVPFPLGELYRVWAKSGSDAGKKWFENYNASNKDFTTLLGEELLKPSQKLSESYKEIDHIERSQLATEEKGETYTTQLTVNREDNAEEAPARFVQVFSSSDNEESLKPNLEELLEANQESPNQNPEDTTKTTDINISFIEQEERLRDKQAPTPNEGIPQKEDNTPEEYGKLLSQFATFQLGLQVWYNKLQVFNPKVAKSLMENLADSFSPQAESHALARQLNSWLPAHKIAEVLGYTVSEEIKQNLGIAVATAYRDAYDAEPQEEEVDYGGETKTRSRNIYRCNDPVVTTAIQMFFRV